MSLILRIQNVNTFIEGSFPRGEVDYALSYLRQGFFMSPLYNTCQRCKQKIKPKESKCLNCNIPRAWDGRVRFLAGGKKGTPYFPTGMLSIVIAVLRRCGIQAEFRDERVKPLTSEPSEAYKVNLVGRELWQEQKDAVFAALTYERGIIQSPTSSGKTNILAALAKLIPEPVVVLIHNTTIAEQLKQEIQELLGEEVGLIKGGVFEPRRVTIIMTQSLSIHLSLDKESKEKKIPPMQEAVDLVKNCRVLLMDEAHHGSSATWSTLAKQFVNAYYRIGVTGTSFQRPSGDDLILVGVTGGLIYEVSEQSLIDQGKIAQPIIHMFVINEPSNIGKLSYQDAYDEGVVNNAYINMITAISIINLVKQKKQILVLCERLEHIDNLAKLLDGVKFDILTGKTDDKIIESVKKEFAAGKKHVLLCSTIFDEGISVHNIDVIFRMGLMKTKIKGKQQIGRGQRKKKDKLNVVHIVDWMHKTNSYLTDHSWEHYKQYTSLKYPIIMETKPLNSLDCPEEYGTTSEHME